MVLAILLPGLSLLLNRRQAQGILFLLLQITIVGWAIGSFVAVKNFRHQQLRHRRRSSSSEWETFTQSRNQLSN